VASHLVVPGEESLVRSKKFTRRLASSRLAPIVAFPLRLAEVTRYDASVVSASARWLVRSREHTNYTYDLLPRNRRHLAWFLSVVTGQTAEEMSRVIEELYNDRELVDHVKRSTADSARRRLSDREVRYGRRAAWYAIVRALKPVLTVESGIDKGLGSCVMAAALLRNAEEGHEGRHIALDINLFVHETMHSAEHEAAEFRLVEPRLRPNAVLITDNARKTDALLDHAEATGRQFLVFRESPADHWFPGDGVGAAFRR
jgi:hypothetical protein